MTGRMWLMNWALDVAEGYHQLADIYARSPDPVAQEVATSLREEAESLVKMVDRYLDAPSLAEELQ